MLNSQEVKSYRGILTDLSSDILVLFNGQQFLYFPMLHVHRFTQGTEIDSEIKYPPIRPHDGRDGVHFLS